MSDPRPYRPNVGAILKREDGALLMCERLHKPGVWQFPQGGVDKGEKHKAAMWREISEELGLPKPKKLCTLLGHGPPVPYDFPTDMRAKIARKYKGQIQTLYVLAYHGTDHDFRLDADKHPEFSAIQWVSPNKAFELLWEVKHPILRATLQALPEHFPDWNDTP